MHGDRVAELLQGEYAEASDIPYFTDAVGGSIGVVPPLGMDDIQGTRYFGDGPLKMLVGLYYLNNSEQPHYKLLQSWT